MGRSAATRDQADSLCRGNDPENLEEDLLKSFRINVIGNIHLFNLYLPLVLKGRAKKVITLSTGLADDQFTAKLEIDGSSPYAISKAAMNTAVAKFSAAYAREGVLFVAISPGVVNSGYDDARECTRRLPRLQEVANSSQTPSGRRRLEPPLGPRFCGMSPDGPVLSLLSKVSPRCCA